MIILETSELRLESLRASHADALLAYHDRNRAHLEPWEPARPDDFYTLAYQRSFAADSETWTERGVQARFVAIDRQTSAIVASVNLWDIRRGISYSAVLGYSVDADTEGRGLATTCATAVVRFGFEQLGLHRIETSYNPINVRSGRVLRKLGFAVEGYARDYLFLGGAWRDAILVSRTNEAWAPPPFA